MVACDAYVHHLSGNVNFALRVGDVYLLLRR